MWLFLSIATANSATATITFCTGHIHISVTGPFVEPAAAATVVASSIAATGPAFILIKASATTVGAGIFLSGISGIPVSRILQIELREGIHDQGGLVAAVACILGANLERVTTYTLMGNLMVAVVAPIYFSFVGNNVDMPFLESFGLILSKIFPIIVLPMLVNIVFRQILPQVSQFLIRSRKLSFYLWALALMITIGKTIGFIFTNGSTHPTLIFELSLASAIICAVQFWIGKKVGKRYGDQVAGGQNLGQRNSAMGIWLAYTYLDPLSSIFPAAYSIWQNLYNSYQLYAHDKKSK